ncbi:hypothetical protein D3C78_743150 [compost metagenome]
MIHHSRSSLHLGVDPFELVLQVIDLYITVFQALESVDHGHAHHIQRLVDLMGKPGGHLAERGHFRTL